MSATQILKSIEGRKNSEQQTSDIDVHHTLAKVSGQLYYTSLDSQTLKSTSVLEEERPILRVE